MHVLTKYVTVGLMGLTISSVRYSWIQKELDKQLVIYKEELKQQEEEMKLKQIIIEEEPVVIEEPAIEWQDWELTFYCSCTSCSGGWGSSTASGQPLVPYITCAADKSIPFGTKIFIEGWGEIEVVDRGGAVSNNVLDVYVTTHEEALNLGRQYKSGYIIK